MKFSTMIEDDDVRCRFHDMHLTVANRSAWYWSRDV